MGLADLSMKDLATRLGVGIATLYRYVDNREALIRLAAGRRARRSAPDDIGQSWQEITCQYAESLFSSIGRDPALLIEFLEARWGIAVELEFVDSFVGALTERGFHPAEAMRLYRAMAKVVIGAAVAAGHFGALAARGTNQARELATALATWDADELPHLRASAEDYADEAAADDWREPLQAILRDTERARATTFAGNRVIR